jgi:hypothetical protein
MPTLPGRRNIIRLIGAKSAAALLGARSTQPPVKRK